MTSRTVDIHCGNCGNYCYSVGPREKMPKKPSSCKRCASVTPAAGNDGADGTPAAPDLPQGIDHEKTG